MTGYMISPAGGGDRIAVGLPEWEDVLDAVFKWADSHSINHQLIDWYCPRHNCDDPPMHDAVFTVEGRPMLFVYNDWR